MPTFRRNKYVPRVEMTPLIDVIFLLLTFFIYSWLLTVHAEVLPVKLTTLASGKPAEAAMLKVVNIDGHGHLFLNREPVSAEALGRMMAEVARQSPRPRIFLAMEAQGQTDRGPLFLEVIELLRQAGIDDFVIVGQPRE